MYALLVLHALYSLMHDEYVGDTMTSFRNEKRKTTIKRKSEFGNKLFVLGFISPLQYETSAKSWL